VYAILCIAEYNYAHVRNYHESGQVPHRTVYGRALIWMSIRHQHDEVALLTPVSQPELLVIPS
jgi:hypothetical protein